MPAFVESAADPPLTESYLSLLRRGDCIITTPAPPVVERELPVVDLQTVMMRSGTTREAMAKAASEWGFFQVTSHGVSPALLEEMRREQARLFRLPFETKEGGGLLNGSYRWGTPTATSLRHLSWSEAFHVQLASISGKDCDYGELSALRSILFLLCYYYDCCIIIRFVRRYLLDELIATYRTFSSN
ncbi:hypothetical protein PR202_gb14973 [Eleusine coracana subsp. coracana]|uniref:Non-haem dioxygenase N-terminal domain-containing protein n=1 Tax=Eleusine coracana subsp. coracana TaxID=191504 RepID=A0AAV5EUC2_ELECO|nr:hypothetical protein PR202_gb14973 [Eleusine coracana subsp. coracana]